MPNILSSKKSCKKERKRRLERISARKKLKRTVATRDVNAVYKILDSQLSKGIINKNKCNRLKSRYAISLTSEK